MIQNHVLMPNGSRDTLMPYGFGEIIKWKDFAKRFSRSLFGT
jgi:hypothetical protein